MRDATNNNAGSSSSSHDDDNDNVTNGTDTGTDSKNDKTNDVGNHVDEDDDDNNNSMSSQDRRPRMRDYLRPLLPQMIIGFMDAISFMVIAPSLVFYVLQVGGTKESYGFILASFSFSSFVCKPALAYWSDAIRQFKLPYLTSTIVAGIGGLVYFCASSFTTNPNVAISLIWIGRVLGGCGAANTTLSYTYVAHVIPPELFTPANALLSMMRVTGMAIAPALNAAVAWIHVRIPLWGGFTLEITPLNSVGLLLAIGNAVGFLTLYCLFEEPTDMAKSTSQLNSVQERPSGCAFWKQLLQLDILVPLLSIIVLNANYQLLETGLAPAAHDVLGWEPVRISAIFGINAIVIFAIIVLTFTLASRGVSDMVLMKIGLTLSIIGYTSMYICWKRNVSMWMFVIPVIVSCSVFPFLSSPTRSLYTKAVAAHPHLRHHQGTMQAVMSMAVSIAGFAAPGLVATYVLRTPAQVEASSHEREFAPWALFAPILSFVILMGVLYMQWKQHRGEDRGDASSIAMMTKTTNGDDSMDFASEELTERLALLSSSSSTSRKSGTALLRLDSKMVEASRRNTIMLMGIPDISIHHGAFPANDTFTRRTLAGYNQHSTGTNASSSATSRVQTSWRHTLAW